MPEWAGYDAVPQDQREFPGLTPVRGREARARDGRVQDSRAPDGYPPAGPGYPPGGPRQPGQGQPGQGQPHQGQPGQGRPGQAPWQGQAWPPSQGPARPGGEDPVGEDPVEAFAERWRRRGIDPREDQRAGRRKRRRLLVAGGVVAVVIAVAVYFFTGGNGGSANLGLGSLVTTFLPGELQQVPNACTSVPGATLARYLPGQLKMAAPPLNAGANSQCTWTLDKAPLYRVLEVNMQAYSPSGLASGDGSATFAAEDAYAELETAKQNPGPRSGQPKATVTDLPGMPGGADTSAFEAAQVFDNSGAVTDVATVVVRYRNVIVTVVMNGLDHANKGNYGPVSPSLLSSAAQTVARQVTGELVR
ncbi:MAG TPA: hypothetical protein VKV38_10025 [Trebonia sp.]|nr:hypothetical protein [Trebonia sp.]